MKIDLLPSQYTPFDEIEIGTNRLINVKVLFEINGHVPLLIGSGDIPRIWLSVPADPKGETWQPLVRDNKSFHPKVIVQKGQDTLVIDTPDGIVLKVRKESDGIAKVQSINLRPFAISIYGDETSLKVYNSDLVRNVFTNLEAMVEIGGSSPAPKRQPETRL